MLAGRLGSRIHQRIRSLLALQYGLPDLNTSEPVCTDHRFKRYIVQRTQLMQVSIDCNGQEPEFETTLGSKEGKNGTDSAQHLPIAT